MSVSEFQRNLHGFSDLSWPGLPRPEADGGDSGAGVEGKSDSGYSQFSY